MALAGTVRPTGAPIGGLCLIEEAEPVLPLVALCGLPLAFALPWQRLPLTAPVPVTDAIRAGALLCVGSQDEMAAAIGGPPLSCRTRSPSPRSRR